jgi:hypothetical protein
MFLLKIFDLLAQPIFAAEIWSICSPVCDSFDCPSRILFGGVFLEYFSTIGDRLNEFVKVHMPPCVVLVINDNPYGLMFALSYICRTCP